MKKIGTKLFVVLTVALGGLVASQEPTTAHASTTFSSIPSGHFKVSKAGYAFRWQTFKSGSKKGKILVFGDFKNFAVRYGIPTKYKLSKSHRTLTTYYRLMNNNKLDKATYRMDVYKYSNSKYRVKLNHYKAGLFPSYKGSSYKVSLTKSSPAQSFATTYSKPALLKQVTASYMQQIQSQFDQGKTKIDPSDASVQQQIKDKAAGDVDKAVQGFVTAYNAY
ncbi:hypothetical protein IWT140_00990 [Secundilactobacillus pentosiphilus]|uniref:Uncharacterized protein n=1 Tax=Secundilactobacillus pentosiphilus TaxID=1714682 RepID=A0A1Z5INR2_9LACO|nr:hypothetical protein [Secundilactobacillus pentosiphilus]GAX03387.1 hypothetical protein IWT140_00990 [Secundilactobacillus pentosiphilus]